MSYMDPQECEGGGPPLLTWLLMLVLVVGICAAAVIADRITYLGWENAF